MEEKKESNASGTLNSSYQKNKYYPFQLKLDRVADAEIIDYLKSKGKAGKYLRELLYADYRKNKAKGR